MKLALEENWSEVQKTQKRVAAHMNMRRAARIKCKEPDISADYFAAGTYTLSAVTRSAFGTSVSSLTCR